MKPRKPLYQVICDALKKDLQADSFLASPYLPSEGQLSKKYKTTRLTVRRSLKLLQAEGLIGSVPGRGWAQAGKRHTVAINVSKPVGFLCRSDLIDLTYEPFSRALAETGIASVVFPYAVTGSNEATLGNNVNVASISGLAFVSDALIPRALLESARVSRIPVVNIGLNDAQDYDTVRSDNPGQSRQLMQHFYERGHRNVMFVIRQRQIDVAPTFRARLHGYWEACHALGLTPEVLRYDHWTFMVPETEKILLDRFAELEQLGRRPTGLISVMTQNGEEIAALLLRRGIRVPRDFSMAFFSQPAPTGIFGDLGIPRCTTSIEDWSAMARAAADFMSGRLKGDRSAPRQMTVPPIITDEGSIIPVASECSPQEPAKPATAAPKF